MSFNINSPTKTGVNMNELETYLRILNSAFVELPVKRVKVPIVKRIIYSGKKTIVLWEDETKTIVGCSEGETFDEFDGFTAALAKKIYGSTCAVKREIKKKSVKKDKK